MKSELPITVRFYVDPDSLIEVNRTIAQSRRVLEQFTPLTADRIDNILSGPQVQELRAFDVNVLRSLRNDTSKSLDSYFRRFTNIQKLLDERQIRFSTTLDQRPEGVYTAALEDAIRKHLMFVENESIGRDASSVRHDIALWFFVRHLRREPVTLLTARFWIVSQDRAKGGLLQYDEHRYARDDLTVRICIDLETLASLISTWIPTNVLVQGNFAEWLAETPLALFRPSSLETRGDAKLRRFVSALGRTARADDAREAGEELLEGALSRVVRRDGEIDAGEDRDLFDRVAERVFRSQTVGSIAAIEAAVADLLRRVGDNPASEYDLASLRTELQRSVEAVHAEVLDSAASVRDPVDRVMGKVERLSADVGNLASSTGGTSGDIKNIRNDIGGLSEKLESVRTDVASLKTSLGEFDGDRGRGTRRLELVAVSLMLLFLVLLVAGPWAVLIYTQEWDFGAWRRVVAGGSVLMVASYITAWWGLGHLLRKLEFLPGFSDKATHTRTRRVVVGVWIFGVVGIAFEVVANLVA